LTSRALLSSEVAVDRQESMVLPEVARMQNHADSEALETSTLASRTFTHRRLFSGFFITFSVPQIHLKWCVYVSFLNFSFPSHQSLFDLTLAYTQLNDMNLGNSCRRLRSAADQNMCRFTYSNTALLATTAWNRCCRSAGVEQSTALVTSGHQLQTIQTTTSRLNDHGAS